MGNTESANPFLPRALRASSGLALQTPLFKAGPLATCTQGTGLDIAGPSLIKHKFALNTRLVLGEEGQGLAPTFEGLRLQIPIAEGTESLNAMAAASIAMYEYRRQM